MQISSFDINGILKMQQDVLDTGASLLRYYDTQNTHPYSLLEITRDINNHITGATATLDVDVAAIGGSIGQVFGSAIGRALAPDNQFAQLAAGTVAGAIGQKLALSINSSLGANGSTIAVGDVFANFGISLASAAAGSVASFLTAEIGTALGLDGFGAQLFNAGVGGFAGSVAQQVALQGMGQITSINWSSAFTAAEVNIGGALGAMLAHQIYQAQTPSGALGGQIAGAVGSAIGAAIVAQGLGLFLNFAIPGLGSLIGTLLGSWIGDLFADDPEYTLADYTIDPSAYSYGGHYSSSQNGGDTAAVSSMATAASSVANAYLTSVNGVALASSKQLHIGYFTAYPGTPYYWGEPVITQVQYQEDGPFVDMPGTIWHRSSSAEAIVSAAALYLVRNTEVIGGDLLLKRAHHNSPYSNTTTLAGDLQIARDYQSYLDNRDVINALIAANPNTAFTAGWAATFARVNDLGLNHYGASDFLGGLVYGYLDSVAKAGLAFRLSDVAVKRGSDGSITVEIHVGHGVDVPGTLSAFASHTNVISDATGQTIQLVFADGLAAGGFQGPLYTTLVSGVWQVTGRTGNNLWIGRDDVPNTFQAAAGSQNILLGGALNDVIYAGSGWDFVDGGAGHDQIFGNAGNDLLRGGNGNDTLYGADGDDQLAGDRGVDTLTGGTGADTFAFGLGDSSAASGQHDRITDFVAGSDRVDLSGIDAIAATATYDQFRFIGTSAFHGVAGELNYFYNSSLGVTTLQGDTNGDGIADFAVDFTGNIAISARDVSSVIEAFGSTSLTQIGRNYYLYTGGSGPALKSGGAPVTGQLDTWSLIGAEQTASGYDVAWKDSSSGQYSIWTTDSNGNFTSYLTGPVSGTSAILQSLETTFHQDLNGDGTVGVPPTIVVEAFGVSELDRIGNAFYLNAAGAGVVAGPSLKWAGADFLAGGLAGWMPIGVEKTSTGYEIAWRLAGTDQYTIWNADNGGNYVSAPIGVVSGSNVAFEVSENRFQQDLNGDGIVGAASAVAVEAFGATKLNHIGSGLYLDPVSSGAGTGPSLKWAGADYYAGQLDPWTPIGVEKTSTGYQIAWKIAGADQYTIWNADNAGNYVSSLIGVVSGSNVAFKVFENSFQQDLNGDGIVGVASAVAVEAFGVTKLDRIGSGFYLDAVSSGAGTGPSLKWAGADYYAGQLDPWTPIGVEKTSTGYQIAWKISGADQYTIWNADNGGNYVSNLIGVVSGSSIAFEVFENSFQQDLNGDGIVGVASAVAVEAYGATKLDHIGSGFYLDAVSSGAGTGPSVKWAGADFYAGQLAGWTPIGAEKTSTGYQVGWRVAGTDQYTIWNMDNNGNYVSSLIGVVSGSNVAFKAFETSFHQDLNGDGVIGVSPVILDLDGNGIDLTTLGSSSAFFDMDGRPGQEHTAWVGGTDGLLAIDLGAGGKSAPDGIIDQASEIVFTEWAPGTTSDMQALREVFDTNHNGQLDPGDGRWSEFRIWQDANGDGTSDAGEVRTLDAVGITSIGLEPGGPAQAFSDGSAISGLANFTWANGTTGVAGDVSLAYQLSSGAGQDTFEGSFRFSENAPGVRPAHEPMPMNENHPLFGEKQGATALHDLAPSDLATWHAENSALSFLIKAQIADPHHAWHIV